MSYQVLARKWRPQVFEDVAGQSHITKTLQNAIATNRLAHAFLFSGPRGVGKTTTARILAKALNCVNGPTPVPCGVCDSCRETAAGTAVDVIEIDGASNRGIEHIRELRETVKYAPVGGKYKIYVIDEVHMLTNEAFNALLKTLEEPPPHVLFIFATTEPQKIPATIHSRCQRYGFKRVALQEIIDRLRVIATAEGISVSDRGLAMIARAAEGSMRDSQSLFDQAISYSGQEIKDEDLQSILGSVPQETLTVFIDGLLRRDAGELIRQVDGLLEHGQDMRQFLAAAVEHIRNLVVTRIAKDPGRLIELPGADIDRIRTQAEAAEVERLIMLFDGLSRTLDEMRWSPHQRFTLEIGLVKACSSGPLKPIGEMIEQVRALEARLGSAIRTPSEGMGLRERSVDYVGSKKPADPSPVTGSVSAAPAGGGWENIVALVKQRKAGLAPALAGSAIVEQSDAAVVIGIRGAKFQLDQVEKSETRSLVEEAAAAVFGKKMQISFRLMTEQKQKDPGKTGTASDKTPRKTESDPLVQDALSIFNGQVIEQHNDET